MLDAITLDQLRTFAAVVDEGSFSAAARKLRRVQSAVSHAMASLERQLDVTLWDRSSRVPRLTEEGRVLLGGARRVIEEADALRRTARGLVGGLEPTMAVCVDALLPVQALVDVSRAFARAFPTVELRVFTETLSAVAARVRDGSCQLAVVGPAADTRGLERQHITSVRMIPVVAREHALASHRGRVPTAALAAHVQIVLSERSGVTTSETRDQAVLSPLTWRVVDLATKHALLRAGLGWGNMPEPHVHDDLARGDLVHIQPEAWGEDEHVLSLSLVRRPDLALGPATQWMATNLRELCVRAVELDAGARRASRSERGTRKSRERGEGERKRRR